ncbi:tannase/feruloyl esterase family alpha/beta hydrolase [Amycolatopsis magusensis]|uniref:tannase/feruloyl esterase family alpha/beta hydrolase n=1 Tax=Amycolatopsis magusensis TaxID=882444 RepID=UPI0024A7EB0B|nr:tannase/feruloyl esterase family alpha/beta hydrolase [Amycolatopsis magusensis]MDI5976132.1 tannase/feruloyl esterase family alpha/beta hydrolase [Amycolatopsis magusensis]
MPVPFQRNRLLLALTATLMVAVAIPVVNSAVVGSEVNAATGKKCSELAGLKIAANAIGLPTGGATVSSAVSASAGGAGNQAYGSHCLVSGDITPVDPAAPNIKFQLALPEKWNGKAAMLGGAGLNGSIPPLTNASNLWGSQKQPIPLSRGYAVFSSDSGHQAKAGEHPAAFGANQEALKNYAGDALKKTRDVAMKLVRSHYGRAPGKSYFIGYSKGGGEALAVAQRWPADWDGVVAGAPGWNVTGVALDGLKAAQAVAVPGAWLNEAKRHTLYAGALKACDALDGAKDGVISNARACEARFDPAALRCPQGADTGDACLSDVQLAALKKINDPQSLAYVIGTGESSIPGHPVYLADHGGGVPDAVHKEMLTQLSVYGSVPPAFPPTPQMGVYLADGVIRHMIAKDPNFNTLMMDIPSGNGLASRIEAHSALFSNNTDLSPFRKSGGKLLLWTGGAEPAARTSAHYYSGMQATMGPARVDSFARYYEIPGAQHGFSSAFHPEWDQLATIENWVEKGIDPANNIVATDDAGVPGRTRPLCTFPSWPKYNGSGDVNNAKSFTCTTR